MGTRAGVPVHTQGSLLDGRYRVLKHLGSGGMASVLLCRDERLDRLVAVKRLHADSPADVERRFVREAKLGASLNHANLVSVFDTATDEEGVLIVMEYVQGEPLSRALRHGPLEPERIATMAIELGDALDHAHSQGVVHRDVKPANVLLRDDGVTKLVDLGIATASDQTRITHSGTVLGTAAYMAPEQLEGDEAGPPADVYAMAVVCFEALAGERPRSGRTPLEMAQRIDVEPPPDLREHWPKAPPAAAELLMRGMARGPAERPSSAGELGRELARGLEDDPATAPTHRFTRETAAPPRGMRPTGEARPSGPGVQPIGAATGIGRGAGEPGRLLRAPGGRARRPGRSRGLVIGLAAAFAAIALVAIIGALASGGGDDKPSKAGSERPRAERPLLRERPRQQQKSGSGQESSPQPNQPPAGQAPAKPAPAPAPAQSNSPSAGAADGAGLNQQGFDLMNQGRYDDAIPVLQRAVRSFPPGTSDLNYAYALYNLGKSLRLAGRPDDAIPVLEKRLQIPNQTETVRRELELARRDAARG